MTEVAIPTQVIPCPAMRDKIHLLELEILALGQPAPLVTTHHFSKGLYARELFIPKGTVLTGHIHKFENLNIISQGDITVVTEEGTRRVKAPCTIVSPPGTKRVGYAHEDTIWITILATEETDVEKIEQQFLAKDFADPALLAALGDSLKLQEK